MTEESNAVVYFSPSTRAFIPKSWKDDGTYPAGSWPSDAVLIDISLSDRFWKKNPPSGMVLGSENGSPVWVNAVKQDPPNRSVIESFRLRAYADPLIGSDRLFSESMRMQIMGESGHEEVRARAIARFEEIQAQYPWPSK